MKLVLDETNSGAMREYASREPQGVSCDLARVEVLRVVRDHGADAIFKARLAIRGLELVHLDDDLLEAAAMLPVPVRTLDAIHLAAALTMGEDLSALVTYDERMARAASQLGLEVVTPV